MTGISSSDDLHPRSGARFVFERDTSAPDPQYAVSIYLADRRTITTTLGWTEGRAHLGDAGEDADEVVAWARGEALKLARALRASGQSRLTRWRG
ncbi:MAG: hypothetical protein AAF721_17620 [Myxococcota bacterium]